MPSFRKLGQGTGAGEPHALGSIVLFPHPPCFHLGASNVHFCAMKVSLRLKSLGSNFTENKLVSCGWGGVEVIQLHRLCVGTGCYYKRRIFLPVPSVFNPLPHPIFSGHWSFPVPNHPRCLLGGPYQFVHLSTLFPSASSYNSVSFHSSLQGGTQSCINVFFSLLKNILSVSLTQKQT